MTNDLQDILRAEVDAIAESKERMNELTNANKFDEALKEAIAYTKLCEKRISDTIYHTIAGYEGQITLLRALGRKDEVEGLQKKVQKLKEYENLDFLKI